MHMRAVEHTIRRGLCTQHDAWVNHTENRCQKRYRRGCVSERDRSRGAQLRAERIRWREHSRSMSRASWSIDERLRKMRDQGSTLDKRLHDLAEESKRWHTAWDDPLRMAS